MTEDAVAAHAADLHQQAIVIDGHSDILMSIADGRTRLGERLILPDPAAWEAPAGLVEMPEGFDFFTPHTMFYGSAGLYSIPQMRAGGVTVQVCAIYLEDRDLDRALQRGLEMAWWLHRESLDNPDFEFITSADDIRRIKREGKMGGILSFEGLEPLGPDLRFLDLYSRLGLRMASLTHNRRNLYADGPQQGVTTGGLTALGKQAIRRMNELGIVVDLVHINQAGFWEILDLTTQPVVVSHTSPFVFSLPGDAYPPSPGFDLPRDRERLEAIARTGGVLGVIFFGQGHLDKVVQDIETLLDVIGPDHIGIGSDLYGLQFSPAGLEDMSKVPALTERLVSRGHDDETILKILGGNFLRVFEQVWK